ncbi:MAG: 6-bladed beta-propeller [Gammaproteobacteria bacterium]|nr:MAG: 6-bladed beta-propeller [Gammaproteobacteria bacterium]
MPRHAPLRPSRSRAPSAGRPALGRALLAGLALALLLAGCASQPRQPYQPHPVFPAPPDPPRFVFERSLRSSEDLSPPGTLDRLRRFAVGGPAEVVGLVKPYGVAARPGRVYVTDTVQRAVVLFDLERGRVRLLGTEGPGALAKPIGITLGPGGEVYVADAEARRVRVYDADGHHLRDIGGAELLRRPVGVALSPDGGTLYVVDVGGVDNRDHRVQVFDARSGRHLRTIGTRGTAPGQFNLPLQADTAPDGTLYVVDGGNFRVQAFSPQGRFLRAFGELGRYPGQFARPKGIAVDPAGRVYVVDAAFGNFQIFDPQGRLLLFIGQRGSSGGPAVYMLPAGIDVDRRGWIYVVDQFFRKVDVYRPVHPETAVTERPSSQASKAASSRGRAKR